MNMDVSAVGPAPRKSGWFSRLLLLLVAIAIGAAAGYYFKFGRLKMSEPYQEAMKLVQTAADLKTQIGEPIQDGLFPSGEITEDGDGGQARVFFTLRGPKGKAEAQLDANRIQGKWGLTQLAATPDGGTRVSIDTRGAGSPDDAPLFKP
jgi:hypothetical protein